MAETNRDAQADIVIRDIAFAETAVKEVGVFLTAIIVFDAWAARRGHERGADGIIVEPVDLYEVVPVDILMKPCIRGSVGLA